MVRVSIYHISITLLLLWPIAGKALVVSDPGAYARMAQQIQQTHDLITHAGHQLERLEEVKSQLEGNQGRMQSWIRTIRDLEGQITDITQTIDTYGDAMTQHAQQQAPYHEHTAKRRDAAHIRTVLDHAFIPPMERRYGDPTALIRKDYRQKTLKAALETAEVTHYGVRDRMVRTEQLAREVDTTRSLKDAQDMTNKLLVDLIAKQQQLTFLMTHMLKSTAIMQYEGTRSEHVEPLVADDENHWQQAIYTVSAFNSHACNPRLASLLGCTHH